MATYTKVGYGQVEPNHLSAQRTGQIYAQLAAKSDIAVLENGQFVKYDYAKSEVNFTGDGEWMLVFNEVKLYDGWRESYKDFALKKTDAVDGVIVPRVFKTNVGDIMTTTCVKDGTYDIGDKLAPGADGILTTATGTEAMVWQVVAIGDNDALRAAELKTTPEVPGGRRMDTADKSLNSAYMADGTKAVKIMRIK